MSRDSGAGAYVQSAGIGARSCFRSSSVTPRPSLAALPNATRSANRRGDGAGTRPDAELFEDVLEMLAHRSRRDEQPPGDLAVRQPLRNQLEHVLLPLRQLGRPRRTLPARTQAREVGTHQPQEIDVARTEVRAPAAG